VFLLNSRLGLVTAAPSSFGGKLLHFTGAPLLPKLRGYFAEFLNQGYLARLGILYLSTCVGLGYGHPVNSLEGFLGGMGVQRLRLKRLGITPQTSWGPDLPRPRPTCLPREQPTPGSAYPSTSLHRWPNAGEVGRPRRAFLSTPVSACARTERYWNINQLSIDYASRPRLRSRLTLGGRTFPRKPWTIGGRDSHSSFATHAGIRTRAASTAGFRRRFAGYTTLSYRSNLC
jgi:hypothetical protein